MHKKNKNSSSAKKKASKDGNSSKRNRENAKLILANSSQPMETEPSGSFSLMSHTELLSPEGTLDKPAKSLKSSNSSGKSGRSFMSKLRLCTYPSSR